MNTDLSEAFGSELVLLGAADDDALAAAADRLVRFLDQAPGVPLSDVAYTCAKAFPQNRQAVLAFVTHSTADLRGRLVSAAGRIRGGCARVRDKSGTYYFRRHLLGGETGDYIASALEKMGIRQRFVRVSVPTRTNLKIVDPVEGTYTDVNDSGEPVAQAEIDRVLDLLLEEAKAGDVAVLAGKLPRGAKEDTYGAWTRALKAKGVSVYVDAEGEALVQAVKAAPALIKPNEKELADLTGREASNREEIARSAEKLLKEGVGTVVVSLGAEGALCFSGEERWQAKGLHVEVKSTVGAGDSMMAAMALGEERRMTLCERFRLAMEAQTAGEEESRQIDEIHQYLLQHYNDAELSVQQLADEYGMSMTTLAELFKRKAGMLPSDYIAKLRMDQSKRLLLRTNMSVAEIGMEVGFLNANSFIRRFKQIVGMTPGEYRKYMQERE